ncbi:unnamed protein product [Ilex paraguariensis]|uniref:Uncharacterized protein n=1 Tax=Ilex paraguariensis TaxID=185542 RepID=A0ABC8TX81_9AQUA
MKVEILSRKFIKPSAPTPDHLRQKKISLFDQLAPPSNVSLILYYSGNGNIAGNNKRRAQLERSLSEALTAFYPLAGRFAKDDLLVDCNDQGVEYLEGQVDCNLDEFLLEPKIELLNHLLPSDIGIPDLITSPLVAVQINSFNCGGLAIGVCVSHKIADASGIVSFINGWSSASRAEMVNEAIHQPNFDLGSLFPPRTLPGLEISPPPFNSEIKIVTRRFVFNGEAITKLKAKAEAQAQINNNGMECQPTRVEVVTAVIWKALISAARAKHGHLRASLLTHNVNMRQKTVPPMPENSLGNFLVAAIARFSADESKMELHDFVGLVRDAARDAVAKFAKIPVLNGDEVMLMLGNLYTDLLGGLCNSEVDVRIFSSWCKFPIYEADFGWGKPAWVSLMSFPVEIVTLMDTKCGEGIEAWVSLNEQDMLHFQQDPNIVAFTC